MAKFNLWKTLGIEKIGNRLLDGFKKDVVREIDRAIGKIESGDSVAIVINLLHAKLSTLVSRIPLPPPLGPILTSVLLMAPWDRLLVAPSELAINGLHELRSQVEGARL
jgi:hypothetical protein